MRLFITILLIQVFSKICYAQQNNINERDSVWLSFNCNSSLLLHNYKTNKYGLARINNLLSNRQTMAKIDSIAIYASASVEGNAIKNKNLAENRAMALKEYIITNYPQYDKEDFFKIYSEVGKWEQIVNQVLNHSDINYSDDIITVLTSTLSPYQKEMKLRNMYDGEVWRFLIEYILPVQRYGNYIVVYVNEKATQYEEIETLPILKPLLEDLNVKKIEISNCHIPQKIQKGSYHIALKTNILYDLATAVNLGIEFPIGEKWSLESEFIGPWWKLDKHNLTYQLQAAGIGLNYWLGNRKNKEVLTGWSIGIKGGIGKYDMQLFTTRGEQGNFINVGGTGGYSHKIAKSLHLNYGVGLGMIKFDYKTYEKVFDTRLGNIKVFRFPWEVKRRTWFGPTELKISFIWLISCT